MEKIPLLIHPCAADLLVLKNDDLTVRHNEFILFFRTAAIRPTVGADGMRTISLWQQRLSEGLKAGIVWAGTIIVVFLRCYAPFCRPMFQQERAETA